MDSKPVVIIDCFVHSESVEGKLRSCVERLKSKGLRVMLITNTPVEKSIAETLDILLYDRENRLFDDNMKARHIQLTKSLHGMSATEVVKGTQRHGLSVLRNLRMAASVARAYGYTHFHRVEVDDLMGDRSLEFVRSVPGIVAESGKGGMFFLNDEQYESNISFHYMYCDIDLFLSGVARIDVQEDYERYLSQEMGSEEFRNAEEFMRHNIERFKDQLLTPSGTTMGDRFPDTVWNTETSESNLETKYRNCTTRIYRATHGGEELDFLIVMSYNYGSTEKARRIELLTDGVVVGSLDHSVRDKGWWQTSHVSKGVHAIRVIEDGTEIYTESLSETSPDQRIEIY